MDVSLPSQKGKFVSAYRLSPSADPRSIFQLCGGRLCDMPKEYLHGKLDMLNIARCNLFSSLYVTSECVQHASQ